MSCPRDSITIIPAIASEKDMVAFKSKYGDEKKYYFFCEVAEPFIKAIAKEFPDITFFGYVRYNNSGSFCEDYYRNIIFNGKGITYLGDLINTSSGINDIDIRDLKVCGVIYPDPIQNEEDE